MLKIGLVAVALLAITAPAYAQWHHGGGGWHGGWHGGWGGPRFIVPFPPVYGSPEYVEPEPYIAPVRSCWWSHRWHRRVCTED